MNPGSDDGASYNLTISLPSQGAGELPKEGNVVSVL